MSMEDKQLKRIEEALLRTLVTAKVEFVRFMAVDLYNAIRCKVIPLKRLVEAKTILNFPVAMAQVCYAGLPSYQDAPVAGCGLDASGCIVMKPDLSTLRIPSYSPKTAIIICDLFDTKENKNSVFCARSLLREYTAKIWDEHRISFSIGTEIEFSLFHASNNEPVDRSNFAYPDLLDMREEYLSSLINALEGQEIPVDMVHAESSHGQVELVLSYQKDAVRMADYLILAREMIKNVARQHGMKAVFMPKVFEGDAGNGCHLHISWTDANGDNGFMGDKRSLQSEFDISHLSNAAQSFLEGVLLHLPEIMSLSIPSVNSFERVGPGCWTGSEASWGFEDKECPVRLVENKETGQCDRFEFKLCDHCANPYLCLYSILVSGMDGIFMNMKLRERTKGSEDRSLPGTFEASLQKLDSSALFGNASVFPTRLKQAYLAVRQAENVYFRDLSVDDMRNYALSRS